LEKLELFRKLLSFYDVGWIISIAFGTFGHIYIVSFFESERHIHSKKKKKKKIYSLRHAYKKIVRIIKNRNLKFNPAMDR
jgi:hypothetical protein